MYKQGWVSYCTNAGIQQLATTFRGVSSASVDEGTFEFSVKLHFKWWALLLPFYPRVTARKFEDKVRSECPAGILFHGVSRR